VYPFGARSTTDNHWLWISLDLQISCLFFSLAAIHNELLFLKNHLFALFGSFRHIFRLESRSFNEPSLPFFLKSPKKTTHKKKGTFEKKKLKKQSFSREQKNHKKELS
jgi:hypothetical protein